VRARPKGGPSLKFRILFALERQFPVLARRQAAKAVADMTVKVTKPTAERVRAPSGSVAHARSTAATGEVQIVNPAQRATAEG
jgi:hypothetical protein